MTERGRPPLYETPEQMQVKIDEYFDTCRPTPLIDDKGKPIYDLAGNPILEQNPPTLSGLALFLGFCDRVSMYDYERKNEGFSYTIKKARSRIENGAEKDLFRKAKPTGAIFWLKCMGKWKDEESEKDNAPMLLEVYKNLVAALMTPAPQRTIEQIEGDK